MRYIEVIVSPITKRSEENGWEADLTKVCRKRFTVPSEALACALEAREPGVGVVVRPNFNEPHLDSKVYLDPKKKGHCFREWRSFNGGKFSEIHFGVGNHHSITMVRLDGELVFPTPLSD